MKLKAIIADDEVLAREGLRLLLSEDPDIEVVAECSNGRETIATIKERHADLLFLDVQMPGIDGFQVIDQIGVSQMPVIVFVTAHNHYAVRAFEVEALDYLTKPVETERLRHTLRRVKQGVASHAAPVTQEQLQSVLAALNLGAPARSEYPKRLVVPNGAKDSFVAVNDIEWIGADSYYARLHVGPKTFMLRETIKHLADTLDPKKFVRVHRSAIVNVDHVREILREGQNEGWVVLLNGQRLKMSKPGWQSLLDASRV